MKNAIKWFGIIALVAVIGFSMVACDEDNGPPDNPPPNYERFPESFIGEWVKEGGDPGDPLIIVDGQGETLSYINNLGNLKSKSGNAYTFDSLYFGDVTLTIAVGGDGKMTISGPGGGWSSFDGTYTKQN